MGKAAFVLGAAVGYVLGARAGRKRYEQIKGQAARVWNSDPVQHRVGDATAAVKQQAAPYVTEKLPETIHRGSDGKLHADMTGFGPGADKLP